MQGQESVSADDFTLLNILKISIDGIVHHKFNENLSKLRLILNSQNSAKKIQYNLIQYACAFFQSLTNIESLYHSLIFCQFKKKSKVETPFINCVTRCKNFLSNFKKFPTLKMDETFYMTEALTYLQHYLETRKNYALFYRELTFCKMWKPNEFKTALNLLQGMEILNPPHNVDCLDPLHNMFRIEMKTIKLLMSLYRSIEIYDFKSSTFHLHTCRQSLDHWLATGGNEGSGVKESSVFVWMANFYDVLMSKHTLYFYRIFVSSSLENKMPLNEEDSKFYLINRILKFLKKFDTATLYLTFNSTQCPINVDGYSVPIQKPQEEEEEEEDEEHRSNPFRDFKTIGTFSQPSNRIVESNIAFSAWENWDWLINDNVWYFRDDPNNEPVSYFIMLVDAHVCLSLVFNSRKNDNDSKIHDFLRDLRDRIRSKGILETAVKTPIA